MATFSEPLVSNITSQRKHTSVLWIGWDTLLNECIRKTHLVGCEAPHHFSVETGILAISPRLSNEQGQPLKPGKQTLSVVFSFWPRKGHVVVSSTVWLALLNQLSHIMASFKQVIISSLQTHLLTFAGFQAAQSSFFLREGYSLYVLCLCHHSIFIKHFKGSYNLDRSQANHCNWS